MKREREERKRSEKERYIQIIYVYTSIYYVVYNVGNKSKCEKGKKEWVEDRKKGRKREQEIERKEEIARDRKEGRERERARDRTEGERERKLHF